MCVRALFLGEQVCFVCEHVCALCEEECVSEAQDGQFVKPPALLRAWSLCVFICVCVWGAGLNDLLSTVNHLYCSETSQHKQNRI